MRLAHFDHQLFIGMQSMACWMAPEVKQYSLGRKKPCIDSDVGVWQSILPMIQVCDELKVSGTLGQGLQILDA